MARRNRYVLRPTDGRKLGIPYDIADLIEEALGKCSAGGGGMSWAQQEAYVRRTRGYDYSEELGEKLSKSFRENPCLFRVTRKNPDNPSEKLVFRFERDPDLESFEVRFTGEVTTWHVEQLDKLCLELNLTLEEH